MDELPASLRRDLANLATPGEIPEAIDERLRRAAHARLAPRRRRLRLVPAVVLVAAACLVLIPWLRRDAYDVDRSGRVDIYDAYLMALRVRAGDARGDLNGDGVLNERDVQAIAARAVRIGS